MSEPRAPAKNIKTKRAESRGARKVPKKISQSYLHNAGLYYLQRFAASSSHFRRVMTRKIDRACAHHAEPDRETCLRWLEDMIARFRDSGLLNDELYTRGMAASLRRRGTSKRMIALKLQEKGIQAAAIDEALQNLETEQDGDPELVAAVKLARRRKIGPYAQKDIPPEKAMAALARAGFAYETVRQVMAMDREQAEEIVNRLLNN